MPLEWDFSVTTKTMKLETTKVALWTGPLMTQSSESWHSQTKGMLHHAGPNSAQTQYSVLYWSRSLFGCLHPVTDGDQTEYSHLS